MTGSSRGIGLGIAQVFAAEGARVAIISPDEAEGEKVAGELNQKGKKALFIQTDVKDSAQIQKMIETTVEVFGQLDILVNNAGYHNSKNAEETTEAEWDFIINTNLRGTFLCSKYAIAHLRQTRGNIINISSMVGLVGHGNATAYAASRGGQIALTKDMAVDLAPEIRVNVICPGWVQTPLEQFQAQSKWEISGRSCLYSIPLSITEDRSATEVIARLLSSERLRSPLVASTAVY